MDQDRELAEFQRTWKPPSELRSSAPREVQLSGAGVAVSILAGVLVLAAIAAAIGLSRLSAKQAAENATLQQQGVDTQGVVTRHWRSGEKGNPVKVAYEFEYAGRAYHNSVTTPERIWKTLQVGSPIPVRFVPARPELNHPVEWQRGAMPSWVPGFMTAVLIAPAMLLIFFLRRQLRLLGEGRPAPARVTRHTRVKGGKLLSYEFPLPGGGVAKGSGGQTRKPPAIGSMITIVYDGENPRRNSPYPLDLVRVAR